MLGVQVWSLDSPQPECTLSGHSDKVNCFDFFTRDDQQYLITGSDDCTAKVSHFHKRYSTARSQHYLQSTLYFVKSDMEHAQEKV
jgi:WD40 repeat protein